MSCYINYKRVKKPLNIPNLEVEIGFGRGDFIVKLANENPEKNFFGIELSQISVEKLMKRVKKENLKNIYCTRIDAYWGFFLLFKDNYIENIYMNYPDPWFKKKHHKRRLTTPERLYIFTKKLKLRGEIRIRSDNYEFIEFTKESAEGLECFEIEEGILDIKEPITKYESKWLSMGRTLHKLILRKVKEPKFIPHPTLEEVAEVFPVKVKAKELRIKDLENKEFKLDEEVYFKTFKIWQREGSYLVESLLSEKGYFQKFFIQIKKKDNDYVIDISPYSEVLRTKNLQKSINKVAEIISDS
ncbi:MAG TPA: tRNA (guanosine(46)-N7)-methyltransferase TrmB [Aquifex aeolicus]|nr:tRNA (guanosine(46)-N7)-methyltransferase TrmB [Aquifex aeolicus]